MKRLFTVMMLCVLVAAANASKTVYLSPGIWSVGGERYALCLLSDPQEWVDFTDADGDGIYTATFDNSSCTQMIICRMNGSNTENRWNNDGETGDDRPMWNQTQNINISFIDGLTYTINDWDGDNGKSSYSISGVTYLYNVGANAYLQNGANWNTHAALKSSGAKVTVTAGDGVYTIHNDGDRPGFFNGNGYVDSSTDNWTFEPVSGANAFKLKSSAGNYAYASSGMYNVDLGADPGTNMAYWRLVTATKRNDVSSATNLTPVELTHEINNPRFDDDVNGWQDAPARGGTEPVTNGDNMAANDVANPCAEHFNRPFDTYQILAVHNGTYAVSVQGFYRESGYASAAEKHVAGTESLNAVLYANDETEPLMSIFEGAGKASGGKTATATGVNGAFPNDMAAASYFFSAGLYWNTVYVTVTEGTLRIGIKKSANVASDWTIFDNFRLQYFGNCSISEAKKGALIVAYNEALAAAQAFAGKAMEATAKSTLNSVIDANGGLNTSTATADELSAAATALNNAVAAAQPSADIYLAIRPLLDGLKVQDAEFDREAKYDAGEYTAISEVYSDYYAFAINKLGTAANTDFTKAIVNPGFEFGNTLGWAYEPSNDHGAKSTAPGTYAMENSEGNYLFNIWDAGHPITQTITGLPKGLYELKAVVANSSGDDPAKVYLIANDNHEGITCNTAGNVGVEGSIKFTVGEDGNLTIGAVGSNNDADRSYIAAGLWWYKVDNFRLFYLGDVVSDEDAAALLATVPTGKMNAEVETALNDSKSAFEASKTTDNYSALQTAIENANASITAYANANTQLGLIVEELQGTNVYDTALLTTLQKAYEDGTMEDEVASAITMLNNKDWRKANSIDDIMMSYWDENVEKWDSYHVNTWSNEGDNDGSDFKVPFYEYWTGDANSLGAKAMTATVPGLTANGVYTVSAWVRVRQANNQTKVANSITFQVGTGETVDVTQGIQVGSTQFYLGAYTAKGTADADGKLTIQFNVADNSNISWMSFKNVMYKEFIAPTTEEKQALADAISDADNKVLGFEANEYAPYNNVAALESLAASKAIDTDVVSGEDVVAATVALTAATWTANTEEVNAFYDGDFSEPAIQETSADGTKLPGWTSGNNIRQILGTIETFPGLADASAKKALFAWSGGATYGQEDGYTMPLKANSVYRLSFKAAGWNNETRSGIKVFVLNSGDGLAATDLGTADRDIKGNESNTAGMSYYEAYFKTGAAGNYVFHVQSGNNLVVTDFDLRRCDDIFAVVGSKKGDDIDKAIFSSGWDQATQTDIMALSNGAYTKTYTNQELDAQTIAFKVISKAAVESTVAKAWYPQDNQEVNIPVKGRYDITFTFMNGKVTGVATKTAEAVTIDATGWTTTVTNSILDFQNSGVTAYTVRFNDNKAVLTSVEKVDAETGLLLTSDEAGTYYIPVIESADTDKGSLMFSSVNSFDTWGEYNFYELVANGPKDVKFSKIDRSSGEVTIPAGKAFLMLDTYAEDTLKLFYADGAAVGIDAARAEKAGEGVYNLNGQRVASPAKGLYIVNGKKVIK